MLLPLAELLLHSADLAHRQDSAPTQLDERFLGAFFLNDYWGRPTQQPLVPFVSNRGLYAGGITLMLGAVGLVLRPKATRVGFAVFAGFILVAIMGLEPFAWFLRLPGFSSAHNGRMVVFVLFSLALLAGWGSTSCRAGRRRSRAATSRSRRRSPCSACRLCGWSPPGRSTPASSSPRSNWPGCSTTSARSTRSPRSAARPSRRSG